MLKYFLASLLSLISISSYSAIIPQGAITYKDMFLAEKARVLPVIPDAYPFALGEQESCIHLKHKKCMNPGSRLKTSREEGAGLFQITRAYRADGSLRFDSLDDMVKRYNDELHELSWRNVYSRPDLQIRAMLLMVKESYKKLYKVSDPIERLKMTDSAYNGGIGDVNKSRIACGLAKNCDPNIWFDHVEKYNVKSTRILYDTRSAKDINLEHVRSVFEIRLPKYDRWLKQL